jgi:hypothetical protein
MPTFVVPEQDGSFLERAPIRVGASTVVPASPAQVFEVLADVGGWASWHTKIRKVQVAPGPSSGVGTQRSVWVGPTRVDERFSVWEPGLRLQFVILGSNLPGFAGFVEEWSLSPEGDGTKLTAVLGASLASWMRPLQGVVRSILEGAAGGVEGIRSQFS